MKLQQNKFYKFRITHSKSISKFINEIGIYKKIKPEHLEIIKNRKHDVKNTSIVRRIEKTEEKKCYDISVTKNENFLINGLLVHNTGLSVVTSGYVCWKMLFNENERIMIVANDGAGARRFLGSVKQFLDYLPAFLRPDVVPTNNTQQIIFSNGSWCKAVASGGNAGRGDTLTMLILDETAFIDNADDIWMAAGLALSAESAKCIMISTPNGTGGLYHATWTETIKKQKNDKNSFVGTEAHWNRHPYYAKDLEQRVDEHGRKYWWSPWYEKQCELMKYDKVKIAQELDLSFEGSAAVVIENWIIDKYENSCVDIKPICYYDYKESENKFVSRETKFYVWEKPEPKINYIIGGDVARGDSDDFSTLQVINADTLVQVAEYQGKIFPDIFAELIYKIAVDYNMAFVAIEGNNHGLATTLTLKNVLKYPSDKIHHSKSIKKIYVRSGGVDYFDQDSEIPGFQTTTRTRPLLMSCLGKYMREMQVKIYSKRLLSEFRTFINKGDKPEHADGYNDDLIFAFAIALFMRDTEFDNVFKSKEFFKAMLDSISYHSSNNANFPSNTQKNDGLINRDVQSPDSDLGWLYGPIRG